ncbi:MAG TPA: class I SAM-dependent methyltransferase [Vicinamibacteria bacterium]
MSGTLDLYVQRLRLDRLAFRIWRYSPSGLLRLYRHHAFDRRLGVNTRGYSDLRYEPTPADVFHEMIAMLPFDARDFVFVDFGSGKGKVLMLAAHYPFRRVVGVELWEDLHRIALENLASFRERADCAAEVSSLRMDAADFPLPEEPLVLYFFNPFPEEVLARVLSNLEESLAWAPRRVYVLFYAPVRRGAPWDRRRVFEAARFLSVYRDDPRFTIYTAQ